MYLKKRIFVWVLILLLGTSSMGAYAHNNGNGNDNNGNDGKNGFKDVDKNHWAYDEIMLMYQYGIIEGSGDGFFKPGDPVTRAQFAKMMVLIMGMDLLNPSTPTFLDVSKGDWEYKYVETAKPFLTGYKNTTGFLYKPDEFAVREDMAVAIVNSLELNKDSTDLTILNQFTDQNTISVNLRKYVATAVKEGIMLGNSNGSFNSKGTLTRAEAATVLSRLVTEEKVTFDEQKIVIDDETTAADRTPYLVATTSGSNVNLNWTKVKSDGFNYYKVVFSLNDSTPSYPDNGYMAAISNVNECSKSVKSGDGYNSGDFSSLEAGKTYYVAITAVYNDEKKTSNVIQVTIPAADTTYTAPQLSQTVEDNGISLTWTKAASSNFTYYKVVVSKYDSTPSYPENGYARYFTDIDVLGTSLKSGDSYEGGDFGGKLKAGQSYYVAITAVYGDTKKTSNVVQITMPGTSEASSTTKTPVLTTASSDGGIKLTWTKTSGDNFSYYKVVLSRYDTSPSYPDNGYATYISDVNDLDYTLYANQEYYGNNDLDGKIKSGTKYYVSITAVYGDGKFTSNVKTITIP